MNPIEPFGDGRDAAGRFAKGNPGGPGNPHGRRAASLRASLLEVVTEDDIRAVVRTLIDLAKAGEQWAVRELLDRTIGKPALSVTVEPGREGPLVYNVPPPRCLNDEAREEYLQELRQSMPPNAKIVCTDAFDDV